MFTDWYGVPPLAFQLMLRVHYGTNFDNAFWDGSAMTFGDGGTQFYPLVGLDVVTHEVSHGFTEQNSNLIYWGQPGGVNESFSDIAGEVAEYYLYGSTDFEAGAQIFRQPDAAFRYLYDPPLDGQSIGHAADYYPGMDVHLSSGVFNKAFYILATTGGWNPHKAFDVFVLANQNYWTPFSDFVDAGAGLIDAAEDLGYSSYDVWAALEQVGVNLPNPARIVLNIPANAAEGDVSLSATVELSPAPPADTNITLSSSNQNELRLPENVTVLAGQSSTAFLITVVDDTELDGSQAVEINATAEGYSAANGSIVVRDNDSATLTVAVPVSATEGDGRLAGLGTVFVSSPVGRDVKVSLTVDDTSEITVPDSVIIPAGQSSVAFDLTIIEDEEIDGSKTVTITARVVGWISGSDTIDVLDNENSNLVVTISASAKEGDGVLAAAGTVSISGTWPTDLTIDLDSNDDSEVGVPATVTIPAGQTIEAFDVTIVDDAVIDGEQTATITASSAGWISGSGSVLVQDNDPGTLRLDFSAYTVNEDGGSIDVMVTRFPSSAGTLTVDYSTSDGTAHSGADYTPASGTLTFDAGTFEKIFTVNILDDTLAEESETVILTLSNPGGGGALEGPDTATLIITDNEEVEVFLPEILYDVDNYPWYIEGDGSIRFWHSLGSNIGYDYTGFAHFYEGLLVCGREVVIGPDVMSGLEVTRRIYIPDHFAYARFLEVIHNPGSTPIDITVPIRTALASGYRTIIVNTSSGDTSFTTDDNWIVTDDENESENPTIIITQPDPPDTPAVAHIIANDYSAIRPSKVSASTGIVTYNYDLDLGPGDTKIIMHFGVYSPDRETTLAKADQLMELELGALAGLSKTEISRIVNFRNPKVISVELPDYVTEGAGDLPGEASISVPKAPTRDLVITLSSSSPTELAVPSTVTIPAGQTTVAFDLNVADDALLDGALTVTITGTAAGSQSGSNTLKVHDNEIATLTVNLPASATEDGGVLAGQGSVAVSSLVDSMVRVDLSSSNEDAVRVPAAVMIPTGLNSTAFDLEIIDNGKIDGNQVVTTTATVGGWTAGRSTIDIQDDESRVLTAIVPEKAFEWQGLLAGQGTVQIDGTYPEDLVVTLSSDDSSEAVVADTVTIPAGQTAANFDLTIIDDGFIDHDQNVTITASASGWTSGSDTIVVVETYRKGSEFQVNTHADLAQGHSSIADLDNGGFVVTWQSHEQDGDYFGIFGQVFDATAAKIGSEFAVNTYTAGGQSHPAVGGLAGGGFVITWESFGQDGSSSGIYAQLFNDAGSKVGGEFTVNTFTDDWQSRPSVAGIKGGGFVITWQSRQQDGHGEGIYGQIFDGSGDKIGPEFRVNTYTPLDQSQASAAGLKGGGFVVAWQSSGQDGNSHGIYGQIFDGAGAKVGDEFAINTYTGNLLSLPSSAGLEGGGFVVVWQSYAKDSNSSGTGIIGQIFDNTGTKAGGEFRVNTYNDHFQSIQAVAGLKGGGFIVAWNSYAQIGSNHNIFGQIFDIDGTHVKSEFQINTYTRNRQDLPAVAGLQNGGFAVTWDSYYQDGSSEEVYGQMFVTDFVVITMPDSISEGDGVLRNHSFIK